MKMFLRLFRIVIDNVGADTASVPPGFMTRYPVATSSFHCCAVPTIELSFLRKPMDLLNLPTAFSIQTADLIKELTLDQDHKSAVASIMSKPAPQPWQEGALCAAI